MYKSKFYNEAEKHLAKIVTNENRVDYLRGMLDLEKKGKIKFYPFLIVFI